MNVEFHKMTSYTWNFQNLTCVFTILVKFDVHFLGLNMQYALNYSGSRFLSTEN